MSISPIESKIKSLQAEISRLNKQNTDEAKKEAKARENIRRTQKTVTKNTSLASLKTKQRKLIKPIRQEKSKQKFLRKSGKRKRNLLNSRVYCKRSRTKPLDL